MVDKTEAKADTKAAKKSGAPKLYRITAPGASIARREYADGRPYKTGEARPKPGEGERAKFVHYKQGSDKELIKIDESEINENRYRHLKLRPAIIDGDSEEATPVKPTPSSVQSDEAGLINNPDPSGNDVDIPENYDKLPAAKAKELARRLENDPEWNGTKDEAIAVIDRHAAERSDVE